MSKEDLKIFLSVLLIGALFMVGLKATDWLIPSPERVIRIKAEQ